MVNVEYEYLKLKDGKRTETRTFYELHVDDKNWKRKLVKEFTEILDNVDDLTFITFGVIKHYNEPNRI